MLIKLIENIGDKTLISTRGTLDFFIFVLKCIIYMFNPKTYTKEVRTLFIEQIYLSGVKNLPAFLFLALVLGSILILISIIFAIKFNLIEQIGTLLVLFVVNEFSPIFTTLFFILVFGLSVHEKIRTIDIKNKNLYKDVYTPKLMNTIVLYPFMALLFATIMLASGCIISLFYLNIDLKTYKELIISSLDLKNIVILMLKTAVSGFLTMTIPIYFAHTFKNDDMDIGKSLIRVLVIMFVVLVSIELASILVVY